MSAGARAHLVDRLELLGDGEDGLDVVVAQFLNQVGDGGVVLQKQHCTVRESPAGRPREGGGGRNRHLRSSGSWCTCCSPGDTSRRWAALCHPVCRPRQSGNRRRWRRPAAESRSSSRSAPAGDQPLSALGPRAAGGRRWWCWGGFLPHRRPPA